MSAEMLFHIRVRNTISSFLFRVLCARQFKAFGRNTRIVRPRGIIGAANIALGDFVYVAPDTLLAAYPYTGSSECLLEIGNGTSIGAYNQIFATESVIIGREVLTANNVYISDNMHGYEDVTVPIIRQELHQKRRVVIGDGAWIGQNACIIGASIGRNSIVAAGAVVTKDVPDFTVVAGLPARMIRRYDAVSRAWIPARPQSG